MSMTQHKDDVRQMRPIGFFALCVFMFLAIPIFAQQTTSAQEPSKEANSNVVETEVSLDSLSEVKAPAAEAAPAPSSKDKSLDAKASANSTVIETEISPDNIISSEPSSSDAKTPAISAEENQFVRINQSLKNIIEENQKLVKQRDALQKDIEDLRGERMVQETRLRILAKERTSILKKSEVIDSVTASYEQEIQGLKKELEQAKQGNAEGQKGEATSTVGATTDEGTAPQPPDASTTGESKPSATPNIAVMRGASEMAAEMGKLVEENQILRKDTIKLHYNLANLFFEQGKYDMSATEYKRVLDLMPQDAATHYNLAFVSAEYLKDYKGAIENYKKYISLDPKATDVPFVKSQILELQLKLQNKIDSPLDRDEGQTDLPLK